jgi:hypothetical protein
MATGTNRRCGGTSPANATPYVRGMQNNGKYVRTDRCLLNVMLQPPLYAAAVLSAPNAGTTASPGLLHRVGNSASLNSNAPVSGRQRQRSMKKCETLCVQAYTNANASHKINDGSHRRRVTTTQRVRAQRHGQRQTACSQAEDSATAWHAPVDGSQYVKVQASTRSSNEHTHDNAVRGRSQCA